MRISIWPESTSAKRLNNAELFSGDGDGDGNGVIQAKGLSMSITRPATVMDDGESKIEVKDVLTTTTSVNTVPSRLRFKMLDKDDRGT